MDSNGVILNPVRAEWESGGVFVTPPGWWHSHHNEGQVNPNPNINRNPNPSVHFNPNPHIMTKVKLPLGSCLFKTLVSTLIRGL